MRSYIFAAAFALGAAAAPAKCLCLETATQVADNFKDLINLPFNTTLAKIAMTKDFTDYSSSVNTLIDSGCTTPVALDDPTFTSRKAFISGQSGQPPIPWENLNVWFTCDTVIVRWRSSAPGTVTPEEPVTGIVVLETVPNTVAAQRKQGQDFKIQTVYSEFNSGAWLYDLGVFVPTCNSTTKRDTIGRRFGTIL